MHLCVRRINKLGEICEHKKVEQPLNIFQRPLHYQRHLPNNRMSEHVLLHCNRATSLRSSFNTNRVLPQKADRDFSTVQILNRARQ